MDISELIDGLNAIKYKFDENGQVNLDSSDKQIIEDAANTLFLMATLQGKFFKAKRGDEC